MSIFRFGKIVLEIGIRETIKILMVWRMKKDFSICDDKNFFFVNIYKPRDFYILLYQQC